MSGPSIRVIHVPPTDSAARATKLGQVIDDLETLCSLLEVFRRTEQWTKGESRRLQPDESERMQGRLWALDELLEHVSGALDDCAQTLMDRFLWARSTIHGLNDALWSHASGDDPDGLQVADLDRVVRQAVRWLDELRGLVRAATDGEVSGNTVGARRGVCGRLSTTAPVGLGRTENGGAA